MKLKVKKNFKDKKVNIVRKKDEIFGANENRSKELIERGFVEEVKNRRTATAINTAETATTDKEA